MTRGVPEGFPQRQYLTSFLTKSQSWGDGEASRHRKMHTSPVPGFRIPMRWWSLTPIAQRPTPSRPGNPQFGIMNMTIQKYLRVTDGSGLGEQSDATVFVAAMPSSRGEQRYLRMSDVGGAAGRRLLIVGCNRFPKRLTELRG
jgi:hypothetical protein